MKAGRKVRTIALWWALLITASTTLILLGALWLAWPRGKPLLAVQTVNPESRRYASTVCQVGVGDASLTFSIVQVDGGPGPFDSSGASNHWWFGRFGFRDYWSGPQTFTQPMPVWEAAGITIYRNVIGMRFGGTRPPLEVVRVRVHALVLALPLGGVVLFAGMRLRRRGGSDGHFCSHCGYDLRATPGRCPECGREGEGVKEGV